MSSLQVVFVVALVAKLLAELALEWMNRKYAAARADRIPDGLEGVMSEENYRKSVKYTLCKSRFGSWDLLFDAAILAIVVLSGFLPWSFDWWTERLGDGSWSSVFYLIVLMFAIGLPSLPLEYWSQFKIEERFGFNRSTVGLWISDKIKGALVGLAIGAPLLWILVNLVNWLGEYWWVYGFVLMFVFQLVMMVLFPMFIIPLFNKLTPLEEGALKERLMKMSDKAGFHCNTIQVIDGSKRSGHSNAYFTGFGRFRRIVLYDTLIEQLGEDELEAVLAHEIGHYKLGHIPKMIAMSAFTLFVAFFVVGTLANSEWFFEGFGFSTPNVAIAFLLFGVLGGLFTFWFGPLTNLMSRKHEYEADAFAKKVVEDWQPLSNALRGLSEKNLSNLVPHPAYSAFHYSHPTLLERERSMKEA